MTGKAEFAGAAAGKVALVDDVNGTADGGHFVADAMLTADFGDGDTAGTISGKISNFRTGEMERDWTLDLLETALFANSEDTDGGDVFDASEVTASHHFNTTDDDLNPTSDHDEADAEVGKGTVWTMGSGDDARSAPAAGDWMGTFYGTTAGLDAADERVTTHTRNDGTPTSVGGEFSAEFGEVGRMVGAFGANSTTPDTASK